MEEENPFERALAPVQPKRPHPEDAGLFESLISSLQAAKLLGNLHVKTLQNMHVWGDCRDIRSADTGIFVNRN